jgi:4-amino-4-deoxy-L-arabinose transferase-like glycosyltransferase
MAERSERRIPDWLDRWGPALLVLGLSLFYGISNWIWLSKNVMTRGWDRIGSLVNSLYYHQTLSTINLQSLFHAAVQDEFRPPLFGLSMATMYKLFGVSPDVAVMANVVYMLVLLAASYGMGSKLGGRRLGMTSAVLVGLIPLVFAMSRYSYIEFSLAALTALSIWLLLASERFEKRGVSVLLGLSLGLGALTKRTFPVFVLGALAVVFFQAGMPRKLWSRLRAKPRLRWRDVALALAGGLLLSALWYFPNQDAAHTFAAGFWLFPLWWALATLTLFFLLQPSSPEVNLVTSLFVGLSVASIWYLPRGLEFVKQILWLAWGIEDPRGRTVDLASLSTYADYVQSIVDGFSLFYTLVLLLALGLLLLYLIRHRRRLLPERWWDWGWWPILASLFVAYTVLSTSIYKEPRAITPLLPLLGVILAGVLLALPWRPVRTALLALAIGYGVVQFFAISYTETHWLVEKTNFGKVVLGQRGVFVQGPYLEVPDSGLNDPGYYIAGDVLRQVEAGRQREGWETVSLGILAGSSHVHVGMFAYDQLLSYPAIQVENPVQAYPQESPYSMAYRYDYVLVLSEGSRGEAMQEAVSLILGERRSLFERAFELEKVYSLPDGSEASLFRRRYRPTAEYSDSSLYELAGVLHEEVTSEDLIVVHPPGLLNGLLETYWGVAPAVASAEWDLLRERPRRVFLVTVQDADGTEQIAALFDAYGPPTQDRAFGELRLAVFEASRP